MQTQLLTVRRLSLCAAALVVLFFAASTSHAGLITGSGLKGIPHPGMSLANLSALHDLGHGPLFGADYYYYNYTTSMGSFGSVSACPDSLRAEICTPALTPYFSVNPVDYGINSFKTAMRIDACGPNPGINYIQKFYLDEAGLNASAVAGGAGAYGRFYVWDPSVPAGDPVTLRYTFNLNVDATLPLDRLDAQVYLNLGLSVSDPVTTTPYLNTSGAWGGLTFNPYTTSGLLSDPGYTVNYDMTDTTITHHLNGSSFVDFSVPNWMPLDASIVNFFYLYEPATDSTTSIVIDGSHTLDLNLAGAPGFENLQFIVIPEPASVIFLLAPAAVALIARRKSA
jgi:hypothetical protein